MHNLDERRLWADQLFKVQAGKAVEEDGERTLNTEERVQRKVQTGFFGQASWRQRDREEVLGNESQVWRLTASLGHKEPAYWKFARQTTCNKGKDAPASKHAN